ncbi:glycoside hydrolase family 76 protein [Nakamurella aerolata]|uniref:Fructose-bisphosphate aldolase n=1 Tax=Nakamurella aerolata TaxID=1656892 RepID=A0A849A2C3_9ACTN|nr:glycoside hydrolase family 76 protein [Nakamurella aerolata]NNG34705.1 fructose-bisphosphate aldolase [Nakamurella aerolata]
MPTPDGPKWAERAAAMETAVVGRQLRRLWAIPATRLGVVAWPPTLSQRLFWRWHYWWQAHLLDCLTDAEIRSPDARRRAQARSLIRGHWLRNGGRWGNNYYDDIAWWALALQRAAPLIGPGRRFSRAADKAVKALSARLDAAWDDAAGGGIPWRRGDVFHNTPANGPAAILLARTGFLPRAAAIADWIDSRLLIADTGLIADGLLPAPETAEDQRGYRVDDTVYTYCQGVVLGAELELVSRNDAAPERIHRLVDAVATELATDNVIRSDGGGNGGLFPGILVRYLTDVAIELPVRSPADERCTATARELVLASARACWAGAAQAPHGPLVSADWAKPTTVPRRGGTGKVRGNAMVAASVEPQRDLSVQLSGWMLMESAARLTR